MSRAGEPDYVEFEQGRPDAVLARMAAIAAAGQGWVNFEPAVHVEDVPPPRSGMFSIFSARGPDVPLATWTPGDPGRSRPEPPTIGILHPTGAGAKARLADRGRPVPDKWVVLQDYSKKGLVVAVPPWVSHGEVLDWLLAASTILSLIPLTGTWRASVYEG
ncbi:MAG: hypothetical protein AB1673_12450 [Actinomycetota bacterium]